MMKFVAENFTLDFETGHPLALLDAANNIAALMYEGWDIVPTNLDSNNFWYCPHRKIIHVPTTNPHNMMLGLRDVVERIFNDF